MSEWITIREAASILRCNPSNVPKLVAKGHLSSRGGRRGSLFRTQVEALAARRDAERAAPKRVRKYQRVDSRPDQEQEWLSPRQVAALTGVTAVAVRRRIGRGRLPGVRHAGRLWVRADHLELVERARLAHRMRNP